MIEVIKQLNSTEMKNVGFFCILKVFIVKEEFGG
jgi:hypothetical protein